MTFEVPFVFLQPQVGRGQVDDEAIDLTSEDDVTDGEVSAEFFVPPAWYFSNPCMAMPPHASNFRRASSLSAWRIVGIQGHSNPPRVSAQHSIQYPYMHACMHTSACIQAHASQCCCAHMGLA